MIIQDPTLLHQVDVFDGLRAGRLRPDQHARAAPTSSASDELARALTPERLLTVPATEIAREHLGRPLPERGAARRLRRARPGLVSLDAVDARDPRDVRRRRRREANVAAARAGRTQLVRARSGGGAC